MAHPRRGARRVPGRCGLTHSNTRSFNSTAGPRSVARATIAAAASPYGLDLRDDSRATNHTTSSTRALTRYRPLTDNPVLQRPVESGLTAGIAVMNQLDVGARSAARERHPQRIEHEIGAHVTGQLPADDPAAVDVDDEAEEQQAFPAAQVGEVRDPQLIGLLGGEVALDAVGAAVGGRIGDRDAPWLA